MGQGLPVDLSEASAVATAASQGGLDLSVGRSLADDPRLAKLWPSSRCIDADTLALAVRETSAARMILRGVKVVGDLDLSHISLDCCLVFDSCAFTGFVDLRGSRLGELRFSGSDVAGDIRAYGLATDGPIYLNSGFSVAGEVDFQFVRIRGSLDCGNGTFAGEASALCLDGASIAGNLLCHQAIFRGRLSLLLARVEHQFQSRGGTFGAAAGPCISADGARIEGGVFLMGGFRATGPISFVRAHVAPSLTLENGSIVGPEAALTLDGTAVDGTVHLGPALTVEGQVNVGAATIHGSLTAVRLQVLGPRSRFLATSLTVGMHVDLRFCDVAGPVSFDEASFDGSLRIRETTLGGPAGGGLSLNRVRLRGSLQFLAGSTVLGTTSLVAAEVGGACACYTAKFSNSGGDAFVADRVRCGGLFFRAKTSTQGQVRLLGIVVVGQTVFTGTTFEVPGGFALHVAGGSFEDDLFLDRISCVGSIRVAASQIAGTVRFDASHIRSASGPTAVDLGDSKIGGDVWLSNNFQAVGAVSLMSATVSGSVLITNAEFLAATPASRGWAGFEEPPIEVPDDSLPSSGLNLTGTTISGSIGIRECRIVSTHGPALAGDGLRVGGNLGVSDQTDLTGTVRIPSARIGGQLILNPKRIRAERYALLADGIRVDGDALVAGSMRGRVSLLAASFSSLRVEALVSGAPTELCLDLERARASDTISLVSSLLQGWVDLRDLHVRALTLDFPVSTGRFEIEGCVYERLQGGSVGDKLSLFAGNRTGFSPQAYDQLADVLGKTGDESAERRVRIEKQHRRRHSLSLTHRWWKLAEGVLVGYGYRTYLAVIYFAFLLAAGSLAFHLIGKPVRPRNGSPFVTTSEFHSWLYALDLLLPVINLGQRDGWVAVGSAQYMAAGFTVAGWILTTAILAGLTGIVRRGR